MLFFILCNSCPFLGRYVHLPSSFSYYPPSQLYCQPKYPAAIVYIPWFTISHHCLAFAFSQTKLNPAYSTCRILFCLHQVQIDQCTYFPPASSSPTSPSVCRPAISAISSLPQIMSLVTCHSGFRWSIILTSDCRQASPLTTHNTA